MASTPSDLDLSSAPPIFILPSHLSTEELHEYEDNVYAAQGPLTYSPTEARVFLGRISQRKRAAFDLRSKGVWTEPSEVSIPSSGSHGENTRGRKRKRPDDSDHSTSQSAKSPSPPSPLPWPDLDKHIIVIRLDWLDACLKQHTILPYQPYITYTGKLTTKHTTKPDPPTPTTPIKPTTVTYIKATAGTSQTSPTTPHRHHPRTSPRTHRPPPRLDHGQTTADSSRSASPSKLPPLPPWATHTPTSSYSCCRSTPLHSPNAAFVSQLTSIKLTRLLTLDAIGVRAYSTSIASISSYPHEITHEAEILRLPGCNARIAELWSEWTDSAETIEDRKLEAVRLAEEDADLKVLRLFYEIWGVGADTARKMLYTHGLRDLDDVVEYHWGSLNRVQQIGVKFYGEFQERIPRKEVEGIAGTVLRHARLCRGVGEEEWGGEGDVVCVIVGGYRRGKEESGDVDVILSHRDEEVTRDLVVDVVRSLETEGWVTHTLTLQTTTSDRDQQTLPFRGEGHGGHGFDSLDKALCVWQDPHWDKGGKNGNVHRRVDIILSPWRTVGCAVLGWSGGTTFQRDIRRFAHKMKGWKFDSSGVRDRGTGVVVDLEGDGKTWEERERRVMEGLGIGYRPATERCTG